MPGYWMLEKFQEKNYTGYGNQSVIKTREIRLLSTS